jgi:hypothetical protein
MTKLIVAFHNIANAPQNEQTLNSLPQTSLHFLLNAQPITRIKNLLQVLTGYFQYKVSKTLKGYVPSTFFF